MELEKIERLKELIEKRDSLLDDIDRVEKLNSISPQYLEFIWGSGHSVCINVHHGTFGAIRIYLLNLLKDELDKVNKWILKL